MEPFVSDLSGHVVIAFEEPDPVKLAIELDIIVSKLPRSETAGACETTVTRNGTVFESTQHYHELGMGYNMRILLVLACLFTASLLAQGSLNGGGEALWLRNRVLGRNGQQKQQQKALSATAEPHASNQPVPPPVYATKKDYLVDPAQLPGFKVGPQAQMFAGHLPVDNMNSTEFFVYHTYDGDRSAETKYGPKDLIVWLNGGPGYSSLAGFGLENGPVNFDAKGTAKYNPYGWQKAANTLWLENPTGVGFSYTPDVNKSVRNIDDVTNQFWRFAQEFMKRFPETSGYRWHITGESWGGMRACDQKLTVPLMQQYVPHIAHRILENNDKLHAIGHSYTNHEVPINLVSLAIGNGAYESPYEDPVNWFDFLDAQGLLRNTTYRAHVLASREKCIREMTPLPRDPNTWTNCQIMYNALGDQTQLMLLTDGAYCMPDIYDVRLTKCSDVDPTDAPTRGLAEYLNQPHIQHALHAVADGQSAVWVPENDQVGNNLGSDMNHPSNVLLPVLVERLSLLLYNGNKDVICNYIGQEHTLGNLTWKGHKGFVEQKYTPFKLNGKEVGEYRSERGLTSLHVYDAGHMVPYYQPAASLHMIKEFLRGAL
ncbi:hypothetical protein RI367_006443 [Sorochytrium milnesiophthora]